MKEPNTKWVWISRILRPLTCSDRLGMFALLDNENRNIEQLAYKSRMSKSAVSRHLRVLHNNGLVRRTKQGQQVLYRLDKFVCPLANELKRMTNCILTKQLGSN